MFSKQKNMISNSNFEEIGKTINKFGRYGKEFSTFAEEFYNYKISYKIISKYLSMMSSNMKTARPELTNKIQNYLSATQYKNMSDIYNFIIKLEANIKYMASNNVKIIDPNTPEKNPPLLKGINEKDMYGFPNGWNSYIKKEVRGYGFSNIGDKGPNVINWDVFFAKLLHLDIKDLQKINTKIQVEDCIKSEDLPINNFYFEEKESEKYRKECAGVFTNTPRSIIQQMHNIEKSFFKRGCKNKVPYLIYRYYINAIIQHFIESTPNAYQIKNGYKLDVKEPTKLSAIDDIMSTINKLEIDNFNDEESYLKREVQRVFESVKLMVKDGTKLEGIAPFLITGADIDFISIHLSDNIQIRDYWMLKRLLENRTR